MYYCNTRKMPEFIEMCAFAAIQHFQTKVVRASLTLTPAFLDVNVQHHASKTNAYFKCYIKG